jgi:type I restriction enzyme S subunit
MDLKPGYKQTEVGVIPEDWDVCCLSLLVASGPRNGYSGRCGKKARGTPTLTLTATTSGRMILNEETVKYLEETIDANSDILLKAGDVLVQRSNTPDIVGTTAIFDGPSGVYAYPDLMMRLRFNAPETAHWFWRYANSSRGRRFFVSVAAGSTGSMPKISGDKLRKMPLPLPKPPEQRAIAAVLSDMDALLDGLDRLIVKKRDLKQAAMQQLLTGKTRLPGFTGEWDEGFVQDVIIGYFCGPSPTCDERNIGHESEWGVLKTTAVTKEAGWNWKAHKVLPPVFWNRPHLEVKQGDVIVTKAGPRHRVGVAAWVGFVPPRIIVSGKMIGLRPNTAKIVPLILASAISAREAQAFLDQRTTGMAESQVNFENVALLQTPIRFPNIKEQIAIAAVLSDMDAEIEALEQRRAKTADLKQAMVQELLTGRTRLVKQDLESHADSKSDNAKGHNWAINEAVVIATLVKHFGSEDYPLGRKRYTKLSYLMHRRVERKTEGYLKKAAGPYNPKTKYGGPEKIAVQNRYIREHEGPNGHNGFIAAENITQAEEYFERWYGRDLIQWLAQFRFSKNDDLEVLATVDMAAEELRASGREVDVNSVKDVIRSHSEWKAKLDRSAFSDVRIGEAISQSKSLFTFEISGESACLSSRVLNA